MLIDLLQVEDEERATLDDLRSQTMGLQASQLLSQVSQANRNKVRASVLLHCKLRRADYFLPMTKPEGHILVALVRESTSALKQKTQINPKQNQHSPVSIIQRPAITVLEKQYKLSNQLMA